MLLSDYRQMATDHGFSDLGNPTIDREVNLAYQAVAKHRMWPWRERTTTANATPATATLPLPSDFNTLKAATIPSLSQQLVPIRLDEWQKRVVGHETDQGGPYYYYFIGGGTTGLVPQMRLWPVPDAAYTITLDYLMTPVNMTAAGDTPAMPTQHHEVVAMGMLMRLHRMEDNPQMAAFYGSEYERLLAAMVDDSFTQQIDRDDYVQDVMFDPDDAYTV